ncbi:MAG: chorismate mutase [Termitinemataceae bacterium]|nr:MAG: chorismate mutase [Termitinemataceae bacterium]
MKRIYALRGAAQCLNTEADIQKQIASVYDAMLAQNSLAESDIVSLIFSVTNDLTALNPAAALRRSGRAEELALFSVQEPVCSANSLERTVRFLLHCYLEEGSTAHHIYQNGAEVLRPDRSINFPI